MATVGVTHLVNEQDQRLKMHESLLKGLAEDIDHINSFLEAMDADVHKGNRQLALNLASSASLHLSGTGSITSTPELVIARAKAYLAFLEPQEP